MRYLCYYRLREKLKAYPHQTSALMLGMGSADFNGTVQMEHLPSTLPLALGVNRPVNPLIMQLANLFQTKTTVEFFVTQVE